MNERLTEFNGMHILPTSVTFVGAVRSDHVFTFVVAGQKFEVVSKDGAEAETKHAKLLKIVNQGA